MKFGIVIFPGSTGEGDIIHALEEQLGRPTTTIWHEENEITGIQPGDCLILPGGFSFGDHLRPGALARYAPVLEAIRRFAAAGGWVLGIGNGFQILCEAGLLPGGFLPNETGRFIHQYTYLKVVRTCSRLTAGFVEGQVLKLPISHEYGCYYHDPESLSRMEANRQILLQYCEASGEISDEGNPNGSFRNIAGICNRRRNVFGLMAHPERASEQLLGSTHGKQLFQSLIKGEEEE
ncbi:MAG: phosphoribosylformylglycinamidine synthase I [Saprospiraceae bacterium]|nr:phosphoribosylformylglycinamidine synthase I [Saprospiraceae bacterium]